MVLQWRNVLALCSGERLKVLEDAWPADSDRESSTSHHQWPEPREVPVPRSLDELMPLSVTDLDVAMDEASDSVKPWTNGSFRLVKRLQEAPGNRGVVDMMKSRLHGGRPVAVKRMPTKWVTFGPGDFRSWHPKSPELPWLDLGVTMQLNARAFPYACDFLGIYCDQDTTYVVTSLAEEGDLFSWSISGPKPGVKREARMQPIVLQLFVAVRWLHELGIAHRDLSLENVLLARGKGGSMSVKLIDFGMATAERWCSGEVRGKETYQAPEMHREVPYDPQMADAFQLGSMLFAMAAQDYPWASTKPGVCNVYASMCTLGFQKFLNTKEFKGCDGGPLGSILSPAICELLQGLLEPSPDRRLCLGEAHFVQEGRNSVWDQAWLADASHASNAASHWPCMCMGSDLLDPL